MGAVRSDAALRERAHDSRTAAGHVWLSFGSLRLANAVPKIIAQSQQHLSQLGEVATPLFCFLPRLARRSITAESSRDLSQIDRFLSGRPAVVRCLRKREGFASNEEVQTSGQQGENQGRTFSKRRLT